MGLGYGVSTLFILDGLLGRGIDSPRHAAIDPNQATRFANCGLQVVAQAGASDLLEFHDKPSEIVLPQLLDAGRLFDVAFIDGNHRFDGVFVDLIYLGQLVKPGGVIFLDDYQLPAVAKAVAFATSNLRWAVEEDRQAAPEREWVVLRTADPPRRRDYRDFVDF